MISKVGLVFAVLLAVSFVDSLPGLSDFSRSYSNSDLTQIMGYMRSLNTTSPKDGKSGEDDEMDWKGLFFTIFDDDEDSSEEDVDLSTSSKEFGPEFNPVQFWLQLKNDIDKSYQRKCKKISGSDDTYLKIKAANKELGQCLKKFSNSEDAKAVLAKIEKRDESFISDACRQRHGPIKCVETFMGVDAQCSFPSEIETDNSTFNIVRNILDLVCENDGNDLITLIFRQRLRCFKEHVDDVKTCANKALYAIVKRFIVKLIESETFEFKMDAEDCKAFDETKSCFVSTVENCVDPIPKNLVTSLFQIIRNETECTKIDAIQTVL